MTSWIALVLLLVVEVATVDIVTACHIVKLAAKLGGVAVVGILAATL